MDTLLTDLQDCFGKEEATPPLTPPSIPVPATPACPEDSRKSLGESCKHMYVLNNASHFSLEEPSSATAVSPGSDDKDELSKEFLCEIDTPLPHQSKNLRHFSRFQPDQESDEDIAETDDHEPLKYVKQ